MSNGREWEVDCWAEGWEDDCCGESDSGVKVGGVDGLGVKGSGANGSGVKSSGVDESGMASVVAGAFVISEFCDANKVWMFYKIKVVLKI